MRFAGGILAHGWQQPARSKPGYAMRHGASPFYPSRNARNGLREDRQCFLETATVSLGLPSLFYASLREPRVFETVTGRPMEAVAWERVTLPGFRLGLVDAGTGFPGLFPAAAPAGGEPECVIAEGLSRFALTMVAWYEWDEYLLRRIPLPDGRTVQAFVPNLEAIRREHGRFEIRSWSFDAWQRREVESAIVNAREWMAQRPADPELVRAGFFPPAESSGNGRAAG